LAKMLNIVRAYRLLCRNAAVERPHIFAVTGAQAADLMEEIGGMPVGSVDCSAPDDLDIEKTPGLLGFVDGVMLVQYPYV
jgi:hypothetical protein